MYNEVMEVWKECFGFSKYEVSTEGRVRNKKTKRILSTYSDDRGYIKVGLSSDSNKKCVVKVHRLVALTYLAQPDELSQVDHINRNRADNRLENLRWASPVSNSLNRLPRKVRIEVIKNIIAMHESGSTLDEIYAAHTY